MTYKAKLKTTHAHAPASWSGLTLCFKSGSEKDIYLTVNKHNSKVQLFINTFDQELFGWGLVLGVAISKIENLEEVKDFLKTLSNSFVSSPFWGQAPVTGKLKQYRHQMEQISEFSLYALTILETLPPEGDIN